MTLKDFIDEYVEHNSLVRVLYKNPDTGDASVTNVANLRSSKLSGHKLILDDWDDLAMDWEIVKGQGKYAPYINHEVIGITSILTGGPYPESINIVIEEIPLDQLRENKLKSLF